MSPFILLGVVIHVLVFDIIHAQYQGQQSDCNTPQGIAGRCIGIRECQPLLALLQARPLKPQVIDYLRQSQCGFEGKTPRVCCSFSSAAINLNQFNNDNSNVNVLNPNIDQTTTSERNSVDLSSNQLLPGQCGRDLTPRIVGGQRTALDEFPWMALLEYQRPTGRATACGGVMISRRYILTAAHCLKGKDLPPTWRLSGVILGEYNTDTEKDCVQDDEDNVVCSDDPITVGIEEQIVHEEYRPLSRDQKYDIALLRMSRDIPTTQYIRPICLPEDDSFGRKIYVAGWGKTENTSASNIKLKLSLPVTAQNECDSTYGRVGIRLGFGQVCAGGQPGKDSCRGDSGGPLMSVEQNRDGSSRWTTVGVVSFGPSPCGMQGWPGVYTKVFNFVPWILSKMRP